MANENMTTSDAGVRAIRQREGTINHYYNDQAGNCTFGVGSLVHEGPCTDAERDRPVTDDEVDAALFDAGAFAAPENWVLQALSQRSGLSESELQVLLADCSVSTQSAYFCAFRDYVSAGLRLQRMAAAKKIELPACTNMIDAKVAKWTDDRDRFCDDVATKEWKDGSTKKTAEVICATSGTERILQRVRQIKSCPRRNRP